MCLHVVFSNFLETEKSYIKVKNKNRLYAIVSIFQTAILAVSNIILITVLKLGIRGYLISNIISVFLIAITLLFVGGIFEDLQKGIVDKTLIKEMLLFSVPLIFSNISWWIVHSSDKIMIEGMIGAASLGIYTAATKIPSLINVATSVFNQAWGLSSIREMESTNDEHYYSSVFNYFTIFLFTTCILITTFIKPFMSIYVGKEFVSAWEYTPMLLVSAVFYAITAFFGSLYAAIQKTKNDMWTTLLCAFINIIINYVGIIAFGAWGAVLGTVSSYLICSIIRLFDIRRYLLFDIGWLQLIVNSLLVIIYAATTTFMHQFHIIFTILILLFFCGFNWKHISQLMNVLNKKIRSIQR